ncbi:antitoxin Xre/MbcA/ParS toxin-binding domain-containing protein [Fluviispira multicolorata]|uniref:Antitoxin Xre/MbcA/ParS-like toxin-binding domain-containing protein n=1 Tax=Fluviispira multicolorata TaxID=2654512 RepID=A0A833JBJ1_9BACT|nr:hypothetical protein [Fluviispira multicolorata]KAB8029189.1 hypothetical protein GCL57_11675 [Fluviispira multicolorata]
MSLKNLRKQTNPNSSNEQENKVLGEAFWNLVKLYGFNQMEQAALLGIKYNRQRLKDFSDDQVIPDDVDKKYRVGLLLGIHKNLRILFPHNKEIVYGWMKSSQADFNGKIPIEYIMENLDESLPRLASIRRRLDYIRCAE